MADVIYVIMRWLHISSMATLIGGMIFGRFVMTEAAEGLSPDSRESFLDRAALLYRPLVFAAMTGLVISGSYNVLTIPGHRPIYHMLLGVKLLLAMHVFAVAILIGRPDNPRRGRMMAGAAFSGLAIIAISAYLRHIF
jgi:putative copper export protein